jgi:hypothetical protein
VKRFRLFGLLVVASAVLGAVVASAASGATMVLPEFSVATAGTSTSGAGTLFGGEQEIKCRKDKGLSGPISKSLGTYDLNFEECELLGKKCRSLGELSGSSTILTTGEYHLVLTLALAGTDRRLIWFLTRELHIECELGSGILILVKGTVLGTIAAKAGSTNKKEFTVSVRATSRAQEYTSYENDNGTIVSAGVGLVQAVNEGATSASFEEAGPSELLTERATELTN